MPIKYLILTLLLLLKPGLCAQEWFTSEGRTFERFVDNDGVPLPQLTAPIIQSKNGYIWMGSRLGLIRYDGITFQTFYPPDSILLKSRVTVMVEDYNGCFWIGTSRGQLFFFNTNTSQYQLIAAEKSPFVGKITSIYIDKRDSIWVSDKNGWYRGSNTLPSKKHRAHWTKQKSFHVFDLHEDAKGDMWLATNEGLFHQSIKSDELSPIEATPSNDDIFPDIITAISNGGDDKLWIAGYNIIDKQIETHLGILDIQNNTFSEQPFFKGKQIHVHVLHQTSDNTLFVGTEQHSLYLLDIESNKVVQHRFAQSYSLFNATILSILEDHSKIVWIATDLYGIYKLNLTTSAFQYIALPKQENNIKPYPLTFWIDKKRQHWIGTQNSGFFRYDPINHNFKQFNHNPKDEHSIGSDITGYIFKDSKHRIWMSSVGCLNLYHPQKDNFTRYPGPEAISVHMHEDKNGVIWIATFQKGLYAFHPDTGKLVHYSNPGKTNALPAINVWQFFVDADSSIYLVTNVGLYEMIIGESSDSTAFIQHPNIRDHVYWILLDSKGKYWLSIDNNRMVMMESLDGPVCNDIRLTSAPNKIFEDHSGRLWMISAKAIHMMDAQRQFIKEFGKAYGIPYAQVGRFGEMLDDGTLLATGGESIFNIVHTTKLKENKVAPKIVIESVYNLRNKHPFFIDKIGQKLRLKKSQSSLAITYAGLHYTQPEQVKYHYKLEGRDNDWIDVGNERTIRFPALDAGHYTFLLKASNPDGYTTPVPTQLAFTVLPYWWASQWAYIVYFLLATGFIYWLYRLQRQRWKMQLQMKYNEKENKRLQELYEMKTNLYTNITHEFRTPLAIILGITTQVQKAPEKWFRDGMYMIQHNSKLLLELINQMLDMAKIQTGNLKPSLVQTDVGELLKNIYTPFKIAKKDHDKKLQLSLAFKELYMDIDPILFKQIIANLLSNAIKFTPENGKISVAATSTPQKLIIKVIDNGIGIAPKDLNQIFDRFYQADRSSTRKYGGTGIGLALVKKWVELLNGQIEVESTLNMGSTFTLFLPITNAATVVAPERLQSTFAQTNDMQSQYEEYQSITHQEKPALLIVEDNAYFTQYLKSLLERYYSISTAEDGQEGIEKALESIPDIILTDVMMPIKDGFELCQQLKEDERTNHIPIVMLTAKADIASRIDGIDKGADAYIAKPFEEAELLVSLKKLLALRMVLQEKYQKSLPISIQPNENILSTDSFLTKLHNIINDHIEDEHFDVNVLSRKIGLDRTQLYRKVKALTGKAPIEIIRAIKMQYAQHLLLNTQTNISGIAYQLGFKDPAYFSRLFKKEMGKSPKDFREA